jgi:4-hydroxybenzoate polyprenyltransferase
MQKTQGRGFMIPYLEETRPKNWLKNIFVFIPITFALKLTDLDKLLAATLAFVAFCLVSSAVYVFNDIVDADKDELHPVKCKRPIASGAIAKNKAVAFAVFLVFSGLTLALYVDIMACVLVSVYLIINIAYTLSLKHKPIIDCFCIAAGFVLRTFVGGVAIVEGVSNWLFLTIVAMSLFMAFGKRRGELIKTDGSGETRVVLEHYDLAFLNGMTFVCAGLAIVFYALWAMNRGCNVIYTVPLIIFIVCKYLLIVHGDSHGDPTTVFFSNKTLMGACGVYGMLVILLLYFG